MKIDKVPRTKALQDRIVAMGGAALPISPAEFGARVMEDSKRFGAIIRKRKIAAD